MTETEQETTTPDEADLIGDWQFRERPPSQEEVLTLLKRLPDIYGVSYADFADWVQPLPQQIKTKKPHPQRPDVMIDTKVDAYTLYMSVAGRLKMLQAIAEQNDWCVEFVPEPTTPTGIPGMLQFEQRVVYREYLRITSSNGPLVGSKPGTAWVPSSGGKGAAGTNFVEKVETSARGRAIAAWGIGILPGSGVASLEEMMGVSTNRRAQEADRADEPRKTRDEMIEEAKTAAETIRQARGLTEQQMVQKVADFFINLAVPSVYDEEAGTIDWAKPKDGQIKLLLNSLNDTVRTIENENMEI